MARDESRRNRFGRRGRGGREQQNQYNPNQYNQGQSGGRDDWNRNEMSGGRPSGTPNWQHDYSYGGSRREFESERGSDWSDQSRRDQERYNRGWSNQGEYNRGESNRGWSSQGFNRPQQGPGEYRREYRGEFGENRPNWPPTRQDYGEPYRPNWPEQRGSFGERDYGQESGGYGEGGLSSQDERAWGWAENPEYGMGTGRNMPYYGESGYGGGAYGGAYPERWMGRPSHYSGFMGTGQYWESSRRGQQYGGQQGYSGRGPKGYKRADDRIHEEICERLTHHPGIDATEIEIKVKNGEVTLSGTVHDRRFKRMAEDEAENVSGVKDVHNEIKVDRETPPGFSREWEQGVDDGRTSHEKEEETTRTRRDRTTAGR